MCQSLLSLAFPCHRPSVTAVQSGHSNGAALTFSCSSDASTATRVTNRPRSFTVSARQLPLAAWPARPLLAPLLYLEHAEYTGLGYAQTLRRAAAAATDTAQLRLYHWR